jgi:hypothetical protein
MTTSTPCPTSGELSGATLLLRGISLKCIARILFLAFLGKCQCDVMSLSVDVYDRCFIICICYRSPWKKMHSTMREKLRDATCARYTGATSSLLLLFIPDFVYTHPAQSDPCSTRDNSHASSSSHFGCCKMIPSPRRAVSQPVTSALVNFDDDDDGWQGESCLGV